MCQSVVFSDCRPLLVPQNKIGFLGFWVFWVFWVFWFSGFLVFWFSGFLGFLVFWFSLAPAQEDPSCDRR